MQTSEPKDFSHWYQRVANFFEAAGSKEYAPHTKRLFRIALLAWFGVHTLLLIPYHRMMWSNDAFILREPFQPENWRSYLYGLLDLPWLGEHYGIFIAAQLSCIVLAIAGVYPRLLTLIIFVLTLSINHRSNVTMDGGDNLSEILLFFLIFVRNPSLSFPLKELQGSTLKFLSESVQTSVSNVSYALILVQIALVYATAGLCKVTGDLWQNGTSLFYILQSLDYSVPWVASLVLKHSTLLTFATYSTIAFQLCFPVFVWNKHLRPWILLAGVMLHLNIMLVMGLFLFGTVMCISYVSFFPDQWSQHIFEVFRKRPSLFIAFDQNCRPCMRFAKIIRRLDIFNKVMHESASEPELKELRAISKEQRIASIHAWNSQSQKTSEGFDVIVQIAQEVALLWWAVPFLKAIRFFKLGTPLYQVFSESSWRTKCKAGICEIN